MGAFTKQFGGKFGFGWEMELIAAGEDLGLVGGAESVFDDGIVFVGTEDEAQGWVVVGGTAFLIVVINVELKLAKVAVGEFADFEIDQDVALQDCVIEDQINIKMVAF